MVTAAVVMVVAVGVGVGESRLIPARRAFVSSARAENNAALDLRQAMFLVK